MNWVSVGDDSWHLMGDGYFAVVRRWDEGYEWFTARSNCSIDRLPRSRKDYFYKSQVAAMRAAARALDGLVARASLTRSAPWLRS